MTKYLFLSHGGSNPISGYGTFAAESEEAAIAKERPILAVGGSIDLSNSFAAWPFLP